MEIDESWSTGYRYFDMTQYLEWRIAQDKLGAGKANVTRIA